jgi:hypothetical protein
MIIIYGGHKMKKYALNLIPFIIGIGCLVAYNIIGSEVLPNGTLVEPFFLIPLFYLFIFIGIIGLIVRAIGYFIKSGKN